MFLGLDKNSALYIFVSAEDAERYLEAIDVQQEAFEFCDARGQRYTPAYTRQPKKSRPLLGLLGTVDIGAFKLVAGGNLDTALPERFIRQAVQIQHSSIPTITSLEKLKAEFQKRA